MLENFVSVFIRAHLKAFLSSLSSASSNLGQENLDLRDGRLLLQDVALSPTILSQLELPLAVKTVHIRRLERT